MNLDTEKIKEILEKYNITGTQFSRRFGIHRTYVYNAISGTVVPGRKFFAAWAKFCKVYGLNFLDFIHFDDDEF